MISDTQFLTDWFFGVTKQQHHRYNQRMADAAPYRNSPRWSRERMAAQREYYEDTQPARVIYERAMADWEAMGQVSDAVEWSMTQFEAGKLMAEAAE